MRYKKSTDMCCSTPSSNFIMQYFSLEYDQVFEASALVLGNIIF